MPPPLRILVLCTANRCRSQMAEGWLRHFGGNELVVSSAGTQPRGVHPLAVAVMAESGVDISGHQSEHVSKYVNEPFDTVITVCDTARESCPTFPNAKEMAHHSFEDPDNANRSDDELRPVFARVRDDIGAWAKQFVASRVVKRA